MSQVVVRITLRIPEALHSDATALAKNEDRSLNWQLVHLLRLGLAAAEQAKKDDAQATSK